MLHSLPKSIQGLPQFWQELYLVLPPHPGYADLLRPLGYKSNKVLSGLFSIDPDAPPKYVVGRQCRFRREDIVLWAYRRSLKLRKSNKGGRA